MKLRALFARTRKRLSSAQQRDWTAQFNARDWADLPTQHPRQEENAF